MIYPIPRTPVYPMIKFTTHQIQGQDGLVHSTTISTWVRKKHTDGKWYKVYFFRQETSPLASSVEWVVTKFNRSVYLFLLWGKVLPERKDFNVLDEDQRDEEQRMEPYLPKIV